MGDAEEDPEATIELFEEQLTVSKKRIETGRVRIHVHTDTQAVDPHVTLFDQHVEVERVPVGREVTAVPTIREEGDVTVIPILEEVLVVEKRLVLKEELRIRRVVSHTEITRPMTLRRQRAEVERSNTDPKQE